MSSKKGTHRGDSPDGDRTMVAPRDSMGGTRGKITAQWHGYGTTGYNWRRGRFGSWVGHDLSVRWRNPYTFEGVELVGGILNVFDAEPSINSEIPEYADENLDSVRGRTFFVTFKTIW